MGKFLSVIVVLGITLFLQYFYEFAYLPIIAIMMLIGYMDANEKKKKLKKKEDEWKQLEEYYGELHGAVKKYVKADNDLESILAKIKNIL